MIPGIPYFGEQSKNVEDTIRKSEISYEKSYNSLYDLIQAEKSEKKIVVIEDEHGIWLTYIRDIRFNYRDREVYLPYYSYETRYAYDNYSAKFEGHVLRDSLDSKNGIRIRYNYKLCKFNINLINNRLVIYDTYTNKKYIVSFENWFDSSEFDIDKLYNLYLEACGQFEDYKIFKHVEGYHNIQKFIKGKVNHEGVLRNKYNLNTYHEEHNPNLDADYRDVRYLGAREYEAKIGFIFVDKPYWERLIDFESLLFCIMRQESVPSDQEFREYFLKLGKSKSIVKYGDTIKLIFKHYWLNSSNINFSNKTWNRFGGD